MRGNLHSSHITKSALPVRIPNVIL